MKLAVSIFLLAAATASCATSNPVEPPAVGAPAVPSHGWTAISLADVPREDVRQAIADLLYLVDNAVLWPEFNWSDHGIILVVAKGREGAVAYCVGICVPEAGSRVWRASSPIAIAPGEFRFMPLSAWKLRGSSDILAVGFGSRDQSVVTAVHEDFHLHYQSRYAIAFGDEIDAGSEMSPATRGSLENTYSRSEVTARELREECTALAETLRAGASDREDAMTALLRFVALRESRRASPGAPSSEEDFWERHEGVPTNLERRAAATMKFTDRSAVATALTEGGCDSVTRGSYFLVLGALQAAVLDTFADAHVWPYRVYPRDGTTASSLFALVRALSSQSDER